MSAARLIAFAQTVRHLPDGEWFAQCVEAWAARNFETLDAALDLRAIPGQRDPRTQAAMEERDDALRAAAQALAPGAKVSEQARRVHTELGRYASSSWRRECVMDECPARHIGRPAAHFWRALRARDHVPTERQLRRILAPYD